MLPLSACQRLRWIVTGLELTIDGIMSGRGSCRMPIELNGCGVANALKQHQSVKHHNIFRICKRETIERQVDDVETDVYSIR
jgi:hypothetical protein